MTSPPPPAQWSDRCPIAGFDHQRLMGQYRYCSQCLALNPNPPNEPPVRYSSVAATSRHQSMSEGPHSSRTYPANLRSSSFAPPPSPTTTTMPPPANPALRFGAIAKRAEKERQKGFKNNLPPPRNAGSNAISFRTAPTSSTSSRPDKQKRVSVKVQSYTSEVILPDKDDALGGLPKRKSIQKFGEPVVNHWSELDWEAREWEQPFEEWVFDQCRIKLLEEIKESPGFLAFIPCAAVDMGKLVITRVGAAIDRKDTLEDKLECFAVPTKKGVQEVNIVIEFDWRIREQLRNPDYDPNESDRQTTRPSTRTVTPFTASEYHDIQSRSPERQPFGEGAIDTGYGYPAGYGSPATVRQSVEGTRVKQEKASWSSYTIDPNQPPDHIDLTTPSRKPASLSRNTSVSLSPSPLKASLTTGAIRVCTPSPKTASDDDRINSPPVRRRKGKALETISKRDAIARKGIKEPKKQSKRRKGVEVIPDSADHGYGTRHAEARQKKKADQP